MLLARGIPGLLPAGPGAQLSTFTLTHGLAFALVLPTYPCVGVFRFTHSILHSHSLLFVVQDLTLLRFDKFSLALQLKRFPIDLASPMTASNANCLLGKVNKDRATEQKRMKEHRSQAIRKRGKKSSERARE